MHWCQNCMYTNTYSSFFEHNENTIISAVFIEHYKCMTHEQQQRTYMAVYSIHSPFIANQIKSNWWNISLSYRLMLKGPHTLCCFQKPIMQNPKAPVHYKAKLKNEDIVCVCGWKWVSESECVGHVMLELEQHWLTCLYAY